MKDARAEATSPVTASLLVRVLEQVPSDKLANRAYNTRRGDRIVSYMCALEGCGIFIYAVVGLGSDDPEPVVGELATIRLFVDTDMTQAFEIIPSPPRNPS